MLSLVYLLESLLGSTLTNKHLPSCLFMKTISTGFCSSMLSVEEACINCHRYSISLILTQLKLKELDLK